MGRGREREKAVTGQRLPPLKDAPAERLQVRWYSPVEVRRFLDDVAACQRDRRAISYEDAGR